MQEVSEKEILVSIEEQNKIEMLLSRIFDGIRVEVQHEFNNKDFNSDEATIIYRKMLANSELNSLINKLVEARINNLIKQAGVDDEKVEQIRNDILIASLGKFLSENSSPKTFASFGNSLNIACLKLTGKQDLLAKKGISIKTPLKFLLAFAHQLFYHKSFKKSRYFLIIIIKKYLLISQYITL